MKYLALIYEDETIYESAKPETLAQQYEEHGVFTAAAGEHVLGGEALTPTTTATTIRVRDSQTLVTDGPFAETKEQLGGYYLLECANLDEAIALAAKIPNARTGSVEVRPIAVFS